MMAVMPRVVVVTTGGTIATAAGPDGTLRPARSGAELAAGLGVGADLAVDLEVVDLLSVDSSQLTPTDWLAVSAAVGAAASDADGVVVSHGTDTLEETALWLDLGYGGDVPVVITGAARPADDPDADGPGNLRDAVRVSVSSQARGLGVLIAFGGLVRAPLGTTKTGGPQVFGGPDPLGSVGPAALTLVESRQRPYLGAVRAAPRVDIAAAYPGADGAALDAFAAAGARGIVLEAMGAGNAGAAVLQAVSRLCAGGVPVLVSSRVPLGRVTAAYGPGRDLLDAGALMVPQLRPSQARVLLMAALGAGLPVADVVDRWG